jgi:hypothetical protein
MNRRPLGSWRAQILIVAGLAMSFAIPYLIVNLLARQREAQWMATGLSVYEMNQWRENGFNDPSDALRWRNARFKAPGALIWKRDGWDDAQEAALWHEADFFTREAKRWRGQGFGAADAWSWREAGFLPEDARRWKDAGTSPSDAATKRKMGREPGGAGDEYEH